MNENKVDLPPLEERPLVTFALFAYNQEKYIREAVEGAFSQTYEPLEIILSDDCSTDGTFEIMKEMASKHQSIDKNIIINRSPKNLGLWGHVCDVLKKTSGEYVLFAAGDDISHADRTSIMTGMMIKERCDAGCSCANEIDEQGSLIKKNVNFSYAENGLWRYLQAVSKNTFIAGATSIYRKDFLKDAVELLPDDHKYPLNNEDLMLTIYLIAANKKLLQYRDHALVDYRVLPRSLSRLESGKGFRLARERLQNTKLVNKSRIAYLNNMLKLTRISPDFLKKTNADLIKEDLRVSMLEFSASSDNIFDRIRAIRMAKTPRDLIIVLARLPGLNFLALLKTIL